MTTPWQLANAMASHRPGDWLDDALCAQIEQDVFFPGKAESVEPAKRICRMCPVVDECAKYALTSPVFLLGVWGCMSENERKKFRRRQGIVSVPEQLFTEGHGTAAGATRHRRAGEPPCRQCLQAETLASFEQKKRRANG
jgi:WhiB family redox-sensing transcriptional regulator